MGIWGELAHDLPIPECTRNAEPQTHFRNTEVESHFRKILWGVISTVKLGKQRAKRKGGCLTGKATCPKEPSRGGGRHG